MEILAYGRLADIMAGNSLYPAGVMNTDQLKEKLLDLFPTISEIPYAIAVNNQIVQGNVTLRKGDTVALLPPFSGG